MRKFLFLIFISLIFIGCSEDGKVSHTGADSLYYQYPDAKYLSIYSKLDRYFERRNKAGLFNGTALFAIGDTVVYQTAKGFADFRKKIRLNIHSKFQLASVSKPLTAYAILLLVHRGKVTLSDSLEKFFPQFPYPGITVHHLLTHRSGLPEYFYFADSLWQDKRNLAITNRDVLDILYNHQPAKYYRPGRRYNYCNTNYALLALIIEEVSGKTYSGFMKDEIFTPLGMNDSEVYNKIEDPVNHNTVKGYIRWRRRVDNSYLNGVVGDKGIYSSVIDLFKFSRAISKGTQIPFEELSIAFKPYHKDLYPHDNYGYGWRINTLPDGSKIVHHTGWWKGFRSYFIKSLADDKTVIVLSNMSDHGIFYSSELEDLFNIKRY
ncbi:MAG: class A beta-lactamase-related serine hydrolase [Ignavibacteria bacterium]|nr:MAG: class A beta-lactamase-related serine hydrolase [Ignavibacteria bacterium]